MATTRLTSVISHLKPQLEHQQQCTVLSEAQYSLIKLLRFFKELAQLGHYSSLLEILTLLFPDFRSFYAFLESLKSHPTSGR